MNNNEVIYLLEANPNPFLAMDEDFADSAKHEGIEYPELLNILIKNALRNPFRH